MEKLRHKRWLRIFVAAHCLVLLQVAWWVTLFILDVRKTARLELRNYELSQALGLATESTPEKIRRESFHHQLMFLSESTFFALLTCVGLYLVYQALKAEERSRETQRNFIEVVTHESKTPLTALKLRLEAAEEKASEGDPLARDLRLALKEVRRLATIFDKALSLNRMEREALTFETLHLSDVVREVAHRMDPLFRAANVELSLELDDSIQVKGDAHGLQNSVQSLLENAVLYNTRPDKRVEVRLHRQNGRGLLSVIDNGPGIEPQHHEHLFDRFYRAGRGSRVPGTGLGLYIARSILTAHDGEVRLADSSRTGSQFQIELPVVGA